MSSNAEKQDALVQLAGSVAHELNNIFTAVNGNLSLLEESLQEQSGGADMIQDILKTARRGIELSQNLQAFAGRQALRKLTIDAGGALAAAVGGLQATLAPDAVIELKLERQPCPILVDPQKFDEMIEELCRNAVAADGLPLHISVTRQSVDAGGEIRLPRGSYVKFAFQDAGKGMTPDVLARALDPVFSTSGRPNRGWGLAKCAGFVRQCGGEIFLESNPQRGTCVKFYLPLRG